MKQQVSPKKKERLSKNQIEDGQNTAQNNRRQDDSIISQNQLQISDIVDHRFISKHTKEICTNELINSKNINQVGEAEIQYLVKWKQGGCDTWEPNSNLINASQLVQFYKKQTQNKIKDHNLKETRIIKHDIKAKGKRNKNIHEKKVKQKYQIKFQPTINNTGHSPLKKKYNQQIHCERQGSVQKQQEGKTEILQLKNIDKQSDQYLSPANLQQLLGVAPKQKKSVITKKQQTKINPSQKESQIQNSKLNQINIKPAVTERQLEIQSINESDLLKRKLNLTEYSQQPGQKLVKRSKILQFLSKKINQTEPLKQVIPKTGKSDKQQQPSKISFKNQQKIKTTQSLSLKQKIQAELKLLREDKPLTISQFIKHKKIPPLQLIPIDSQEDTLEQTANSNIKMEQKSMSCMQTVNNIQTVNKRLCIDCQRNRKLSKRLNIQYNKCLQKPILDFDQLYQKQQIVDILQNGSLSFRTNDQGQHLFHHKYDKLIDISQNKQLCKLILRKLVIKQQIHHVMKQYHITKFAKMNDLWFALLKINDSRGRYGLHCFRYTVAEYLLPQYRYDIIAVLLRDEEI